MRIPSASPGGPIIAVLAALCLARVGVVSGSVSVLPTSPAACQRCGWRPPATRFVERVRGVDDLIAAIGRARPETTILLEPGTYTLKTTVDIRTPRIVLRGADGDRSRVVLRGSGMAPGGLGIALSVSAPDVTIADLTVGYAGYHGVQVHGEAGAVATMLHNVRVVDAGQQLVKVSLDRGSRLHADGGTLACSLVEYTDHAPSDYTNGIDIIGAQGWTVRDNEFRRIHGPVTSAWRAGPAILAWGNSLDTIVERNLVTDSFRGIALGIAPGGTSYARDGETRLDHQRGVVRNNVVWNPNLWADEGIEANAASDARIEHNTVFVEGLLVRRSISVRFDITSAVVRNNLTNRPIVLRDGGRAELAGNVDGARREWFLNAADANLRLAGHDVPAIAAGVPLPDDPEDFDRVARRPGAAPAAGAFECAPSQCPR